MAAVTITAPSQVTMSGSTLAAPAPSALPPHQHRSSFSSASALGPPQLPPASSSSSFDAKNLKMSQSQQSSQQSAFSINQPSSQQMHRFSEPAPMMNGVEDPRKLIYRAVYSGVDVYEMEVNGIAVMRRRHDSCLNATQILKVANIDKGKRTKILEKEIQTGEHEKVQGGYGKYQGTWIKFERGVQVCRQYGVEELLRPLLEHDMGQEGQDDFNNTPTKEQAMAAQRKRMYSANNAEGRTHGPSGTFFKNISSTASNAVAAISKARFDSPGPRGRNGGPSRPGLSRQSSMQNADDFPGNSQQSFASDFGHSDVAYSTQNTQIFGGDEPPRKRQRVFTPADSFGGYNSHSMEIYANEFPGSPTEPNASFMYSQVNMDAQSDSMPLVPLPFDLSPEAERKRNQLMSLFLDNNGNQPYGEILQSMSPLDLDSPIDASSHTALHWAATLARIPLLKALIASGANPYRVNSSGETALMRASAVTNNSDQVSFPELLDVLGSTIDIRDNRGRTVLHHIAVTSAVKGRSHSSRYYLESLLEWVVRQGGVASSQEGSSPKMGIGRFMSEIVNAQDKSGDTALNIAARIGNRSIVAQLIEIEADPTIANKAGLRPIDFGVGTDAGNVGLNGDATSMGDKAAPTSSTQKSRESGEEIITSITHLLNETTSSFQAELKKKQKDLDSLHSSLRTTSTEVGESRRKLESLQARAKAQSLGRQKTLNLSRGLEEEQKRLSRLEQNLPGLNTSNEWEVKITAALDEVATKGASAEAVSGSLPVAGILRARVQALRHRNEATKKSVAQLRGRSKDVEMKYKQLVALCTNIQEAEVDAVVDSLLRAVESEKGDLEIGRVRRFLGGIDGVVG